MLVLSRKVGECLVLTVGTTTIRVYVNSILNSKCRVAVEAPRNVGIDREEIYLRKIGSKK